MSAPLDPQDLPSERKFGLTFAVIFGAVAAWLGVTSPGGYGWLLWLAAAVAFGGLGWLAPRVLAPANRLWYRFGLLLGRIVSPIVLGVIFFGMITPLALVMRLAGRDELRLARGKAASYWIDRTPPGPAPDSFRHQF